MKSFGEFYKKLMKNPKKGMVFVINSERKTLKGMSRFTSVNYSPKEYLKLSFKDGSGLVVLPSEKNISYSTKQLGKAKGIKDSDIGKEKLFYLNEEYRLDNANDYQFALQVYVGMPGRDIEGECKFSDYVSKDGKRTLSLGWLTSNGKREDVLVEDVSPNNILLEN